MKECRRCYEVKETTEFFKDSRTKDRLNSWCKECRRKYKRTDSYKRQARNSKTAARYARYEQYRLAEMKREMRKYGITVEIYNALLLEQNNSCATCLRAAKEFTKRLAVDHCHTTGKVRGLLCSQCNTALGKYRDDIETMERAITYLKRHRSVG